MIIRKLRLQKGWSQEHLSQISGLSTRTIQRIERGHKASLEFIRML
jgi:transcriptional regulator with XRE-family HTH domain